ncbi:hypothetical protein HN51_000243 [Arachis hypogaea]
MAGDNVLDSVAWTVGDSRWRVATSGGGAMNLIARREWRPGGGCVATDGESWSASEEVVEKDARTTDDSAQG